MYIHVNRYARSTSVSLFFIFLELEDELALSNPGTLFGLIGSFVLGIILKGLWPGFLRSFVSVFMDCWSIIFSGMVFRLQGAEMDFFMLDLGFFCWGSGGGGWIRNMDGFTGDFGLVFSGVLNCSWIRSGVLSWT